ncbi:FAD-binding oxidoreductase [Actinocatenispora rupis]|uniref:Oxidoreductase n=1 Tax=Actinocatenispora rupis TaxID=519421 RepID=A0A8J3J7T8_9ACTN|nr:FAD-binding oxidoreductase [Actinocatenispora rupis]GID11709.1 oxidoreductase [Actinocatenispora rupis]
MADTGRIETLPEALHGKGFRPGDPGYDELCSGWNSRVRHRPDLAVAATDPADVAAAVRLAGAFGLSVRVQGTGHGALLPQYGGVLVATRIGGATVDPAGRTVTVGAGTRWQDVLAAAAPYGLAGLTPPAPSVGVTGYALGGGAGWFARRYGLCSDSVLAAEVVTADGRIRWVDGDSEPELFRGLRGADDNLGIVTRLRLRLFPIAEIYGGARYWPIERAAEIIGRYREWTGTVPDDTTSSVAFMQFPASPKLPEPLRGKAVVGVRAVHLGPGGPDVLAPLRALPGELTDSYRTMPVTDIGSITNDSTAPLPRIGYSRGLSDVDDKLTGRLVDAAHPGATYGALELRHAGGAHAHDDPGLGYDGAGFLLFTMAVTPDDAAVRGAEEFAAALTAATADHLAPRNLMSFLLAPPGPVDMAERVRGVFAPWYYERLAALKSEYDPAGMFGGDRPIVP